MVNYTLVKASTTEIGGDGIVVLPTFKASDPFVTISFVSSLSSTDHVKPSAIALNEKKSSSLHKKSSTEQNKIALKSVSTTGVDHSPIHYKYISLTETWDSTQIPFLPEFKKQILLPIQELVKEDHHLVLIDDSADSVRSKVFVLLDICTSNYGDDTSDDDSDEEDERDGNFEQNNWDLLPCISSTMHTEHTSTSATEAFVVETVCIATKPCFRIPVDSSSSNNSDTVAQSGAVKAERKRRTASSIQGEVSEYLRRAIAALGWENHIPLTYVDFMCRLVCAIVRVRRIPRDIKHLPNKVKALLQSSSSGEATEGQSNAQQTQQTAKALPLEGTGLAVFEFFSGIGGMRLGLPERVRGIPVGHVTAFDISSVANEVYKHNFEQSAGQQQEESRSALDTKHGVLKRVAIDGLKLAEVDGAADIWTMSPPCQPYTTTKGANRQDELDNRSRPIFHLMRLLLQMKELPRWIVLENVHGFVESNVLQLWKQVIRRCGYRYKQYLLTPELSVGLPNCRKRYYFVAEHSSSVDSRFLSQFTSGIITNNLNSLSGGSCNSCGSSNSDSRADDVAADPVAKRARSEEQQLSVCNSSDCENVESNADIIASDGETVHTSLPPHIASQFPPSPVTIGQVLSQRLAADSLIAPSELAQLWLPERVLTATWAADNLSIVSPYERISYCFTKGYGRIYDRSTGSCFYPEATGAEVDAAHKIDRSDLTLFRDKLRLFHPDEMLLLSGFPVGFSWPEKMSLQHKWSCIGNSVNVTVVRAVMKCLFD